MLAKLFKKVLPGAVQPAGSEAPSASTSAAGTPAASAPAAADDLPPGHKPESEVGLGAVYGERIDWPSSALDGREDLEQMAGLPIFELWQKIPGGHKWLHYFRAYEKVFGARRAEPLRVLEIGVYRGASLKLWREYFTHPDTVIAALDIQPGCTEYADPARNVHVRIGDQTDAAFLRSVVEEFGPFDIIIDDGSHISSHMIKSFNELFLDGLKDPGIYLVEDLHANYWKGYRDSELSFIDLARQLVEVMHFPYMLAPDLSYYVLGWPQRLTSMSVPLVTTLIEEIRFFDSIVVVTKKRRKYIPLSYHMME